MAYSKQTWDTTSFVTPTKMNHIEDGIEAVENEIPDEIKDLSDVDITTPTNGQILKYDSSASKWKNANESSGGLLPHLIINSETGATVTATLGGTTYTATETSTGIYEVDVNAFGFYTITMVKGVDEVIKTLMVDTVKVYTITVTTFTATITVTFPSGASCTCDGVTSSTSPHTFTVNSADTYTVTVVYGGNTYTEDVVITTDGQAETLLMPNGSEILPVNDVANWLFVGGRTENYTTVSQILADSTCLSALIASSEAVDYLVRSTGFASDITSDSGAMTLIGLNNYCANSLLADSTWLTAICNSTYFESVLNVKVPTMTSNTTPSGTCFGDYTAQSQYDFFKVFDNNASTLANPQTNQKLGYQFTSAVRVFKMFLKNATGNNNLVKTFKIVGSNDGSSWTDITETLTSTNQSQGGESSYVFANATAYNRYAIMPLSIVSTSTYANIAEIQFYGREDV